MNRTVLVACLVAIANTAVVVTSASAAEPFIESQQTTEYLARDRLIGTKVHNDDDKIIGDIEDLIISNEGKVVGVIMGVGGFLGVGEKRVGIEMSALALETLDDGVIKATLSGVTKETLEATPAYKRINPPKGWIQRTVEKGRELRDKSTDTAKDAYEAAKEKSAPVIEQAKEAADRAIDSVQDPAETEKGAEAEDASQPAAPTEDKETPAEQPAQ